MKTANIILFDPEGHRIEIWQADSAEEPSEEKNWS